jgi:hypothetical protein
VPLSRFRCNDGANDSSRRRKFPWLDSSSDRLSRSATGFRKPFPGIKQHGPARICFCHGPNQRVFVWRMKHEAAKQWPIPLTKKPTPNLSSRVELYRARSWSMKTLLPRPPRSANRNTGFASVSPTCFLPGDPKMAGWGPLPPQTRRSKWPDLRGADI